MTRDDWDGQRRLAMPRDDQGCVGSTWMTTDDWDDQGLLGMHGMTRDDWDDYR